MKNIKYLLLFVSVLSVLLSCKNEPDITIDGNQFTIQPKVEDGRLHFKSMEELKVYYEEVDAYLQETELGNDEALALIEKNHRSLRSVFENGPIPIGGQRDSIFNIVTDDYIVDDIRLSILNENAEVSVGDKVYVYLSENNVMEVDANDVDVINSLRDFEKGNDQSLPWEIATENTNLLSDIHQMHITVSDKTTSPTVAGQYTVTRYQLNFMSSKIPCNGFQKGFQASLLEYVDTYDDMNTLATNDDQLINTSNSKAHKGDFVLNFNEPGTPNQTFTNVTNFATTHTYATAGTYNPTVSVTFFNSSNGFSQSIAMPYDPVTVGDVCKKGNLSKSEWKYYNGYAVACEIWYKSDFVGSHAGAKTTSKDGWNGSSWNNRKAFNIAKITATFRNDACGVVKSGNKTDACADCNSKRASINSGFWWPKRDVSNGDIFSWHHMAVPPSIIILHDMVLNPCP